MITGITLVGWILATVAVAGIIGAVKNETWISILTRTVSPSSEPVEIM